MRPAVKGALMPLGTRIPGLRTNPGHQRISTRGYAQIATLKDIPTVSLERSMKSSLELTPLKKDDAPFEVPIADTSFETYHFDPPAYTVETTKNQLKQLYRDMTTIR